VVSEVAFLKHARRLLIHSKSRVFAQEMRYNKEVKLGGYFMFRTKATRTLIVIFLLMLSSGITLYVMTKETPESRLAKNLGKIVPLTPEQQKLVDSRLDELSGDSDNDGLKDWEELIYKTDPKNPDTDGDGTNDGDEIKQERNPLIIGPKDSLSNPIADEKALQDASTSNTFTKQFGETLLSSDVFVGLMQNGTPSLSQGDTEALANQLAEDGKKFLAVNEDELFASIRIAPKDTHTEAYSMIKYLNGLGKIQNEYFMVAPEDDPASIITEATKSKDVKRFAELKKSISIFGAALAEVKALSVPRPLLDVHKKELLLLASMEKQLTAIMDAEKDPLGASTAIAGYIALRKEGALLHKKILEIIQQNHLVFLSGDAGSFFTETSL